MAKVTITNLNTLLDGVVTNNIAVQTAQAAVTQSSTNASNAAASALSAASSKNEVDGQVLAAQAIANDISDDVASNEVIKDFITDLETAVRAMAESVEVDKDEVQDILDDVITKYSAVLVRYNMINALVTDFHTKYLGASLEAPNASWEGMELATGMLYYDIAKNSLMIWINANIWVPIIEAVNMLMATNNLADLTDKEVARVNLNVYSREETITLLEEQDEASEIAFDGTVSGLAAENVQSAVDEVIAQKGQPGGVASLDVNGHVPAAQLPSYVDDVIEVATKADLPIIGETDKIYVVVTDELSNNDTSSYRWTGTAYAMVSNTLTGADIKSLYESNANTNAFTDAEKDKLADTEIASQLDSRDTANRNTDNHVDGTTNGVYTIAERSKLSGIESGATADQTAGEIETLYEGLANTNKYTDAEKTKVANLSGVNTGDQDISGKVDYNIINIDTVGAGILAGSGRLAWTKGFTAFTGAIKIELTGLYDEASMVGRMKIVINQAVGDDRVLYIDGRWLNTTHAWDEANVVEVTTAANKLNVRFAKSDTSVYLIIGETTTSWNALRVMIDEVVTNYNASLNLGFVISSTTDLAGLTSDYTKASVDNLYTDTEKSKLLGIEAGAKADQIASEVPVTPVGSIASTNVQAAIQELDSEKEPKNANIQSHISSTSNPHSVTKAQIGLGNVDNTSDANKPVSTATQTALNDKSDSTHNHSGTYEPADATILKDADIGSTVQAYSANTTLQGNTFNGVSQLVQLDVAGKLPALDGSLLSNLPVITDHGLLSGLADDDHTQYHNDTRGDARYYTKTVIDTSNLFRADKYLAAQNIAAMIYDIDGNLSKVQYVNIADVDYEVLTYTTGTLTNIAHYVGSVLKGNSVLSYTSGALTSVVFTGV